MPDLVCICVGRHIPFPPARPTPYSPHTASTHIKPHSAKDSTTVYAMRTALAMQHCLQCTYALARTHTEVNTFAQTYTQYTTYTHSLHTHGTAQETHRTPDNVRTVHAATLSHTHPIPNPPPTHRPTALPPYRPTAPPPQPTLHPAPFPATAAAGAPRSSPPCPGPARPAAASSWRSPT